jgi:hypothetical protein
MVFRFLELTATRRHHPLFPITSLAQVKPNYTLLAS